MMQQEQIRAPGGRVRRAPPAQSLVQPGATRARAQEVREKLDASYANLVDSMVDDGVLESTPEAAQEFVDVTFEQPIGE